MTPVLGRVRCGGKIVGGDVGVGLLRTAAPCSRNLADARRRPLGQVTYYHSAFGAFSALTIMEQYRNCARASFPRYLSHSLEETDD
jgi:hypothetical protein